jgi:hypothetical protein
LFKRGVAVQKSGIYGIWGEQKKRERNFEKMRRAYFKAMAMTERKNNGLQRKIVPEKYRKNMTEFKAY